MTERTDCPACRARVIIARTGAGKTVVLNYDPDPAGSVAAQHGASGAWTARYAAPGDALYAAEHRFTRHWATSPGCAPEAARRQREAAQDAVSFLDQWRAAQAGLHAAQRRGKGRRAEPEPSGYRIPPPALPGL